MPGKGTDINLRHLFLNMSINHDNGGSRVKFDSVEWGHLWEILGRYGFGTQFLQWLKLLYQSPTTCIRANCRIYKSFPLQSVPFHPSIGATDHLAQGFPAGGGDTDWLLGGDRVTVRRLHLVIFV